MLERLAKLLGFGPKPQQPKPDAISAELYTARERNERAASTARDLLSEMLQDKSDMAATLNDFVGKMK